MTDAVPGEPLVRVRGLRVTRSRDVVLDGIDLDLRAGEVTAVLGPNGAGKSTLVSAIAGIVAPSAGSIERHGRVATALQDPGLARRSARANVEIAQAWWGIPRAERRGRADRALAALGAAELGDRRATALSGGEQRRVHLARAIAVDPEVLVLDEPFASLDAETRAGLLQDAASVIRGRAGATLVVVHDRAEAWALADRVVVLVDGRVVAQGEPQRVLDAPPSEAVARFLGYDGVIRRERSVLLTRAAHVTLEARGAEGSGAAGSGAGSGAAGSGAGSGAAGSGDVEGSGSGDPDGFEGSIVRVTPIEDGFRVRVVVADGELSAEVRGVRPAVGDRVRVVVRGGVEFAKRRSS
ncbi:ATP-binding cassette domain-containing protein [Galbitalea sp. SE-J8]|uniref:ATP-binding cassette domain-containing protein n=1 Tax=Galbitalea sp. SE-J8 TaxID=3054952 RepID=UPI00259D0F95|nr:ATP-binding cassette domain-containing protein [Galbitalea sp. SE-J8]MDM4762865.1 ATP-binding cassette domain-containing protein [Galbitalea sp. SE-J8]